MFASLDRDQDDALDEAEIRSAIQSGELWQHSGLLLLASGESVAGCNWEDYGQGNTAVGFFGAGARRAAGGQARGQEVGRGRQ